MTKMKSKKMTKSTFAIIIMAIAMVAMLAFGGTYAYFTATTDGWKSSNFVTATVKLSDNASTALTDVVGTKILPGAKLVDNKTVAVKNESNVQTWIFVKLSAVTVDGKTYVVHESADKKDGKLISVDTSASVGEGKDWTQYQEGIYYIDAPIAAATTGTSYNFTFSVTLNANIQSNNAQTGGETTNVYVGETMTPIMGVEIVVEFEAFSIQRDNYTTVGAAYDAAILNSITSDTGVRA